MGKIGFTRDEEWPKGTSIEDYVGKWVLVTTPQTVYSGKLISVYQDNLLLLPYSAEDFREGVPVNKIIREGLPYRIHLGGINIRETSEESTIASCNYKNRQREIDMFLRDRTFEREVVQSKREKELEN